MGLRRGEITKVPNSNQDCELRRWANTSWNYNRRRRLYLKILSGVSATQNTQGNSSRQLVSEHPVGGTGFSQHGSSQEALGQVGESNMQQHSGDSKSEKPPSGPYLLGENFKRLYRVAHCKKKKKSSLFYVFSLTVSVLVWLFVGVHVCMCVGMCFRACMGIGVIRKGRGGSVGHWLTWEDIWEKAGRGAGMPREVGGGRGRRSVTGGRTWRQGRRRRGRGGGRKARGRDSETKEEICKQEQKGQVGTTRR